MSKKRFAVLLTVLLCLGVFFLPTDAETHPYDDIVGEIVIEPAGHVHTFDQKNVDGRYLCESASCDAKATYYYSCSCGEKGTDTFETGDPLGYDYGNWVVTLAPTVSGEGTLARDCLNDIHHIDKFVLPVLNPANGYESTVLTKPTTDTVGSARYDYTKDGQTFSFTIELPRLTPSVKLKNTPFQTAWGCSFSTDIVLDEAVSGGVGFELIFDKNLVSLTNYTVPEGATVRADGNVLSVTADGDLPEGTVLTALTFFTSDELTTGTYDFLSVSGQTDPSPFTPITIFPIGDVNMDGTVGARDVTTIRQYVVKMITLTDAQLRYANVYADYSDADEPIVSARDATLITQYVVKMPVDLGDRVTLTFEGNTETISFAVRSGETLRRIPAPPDGFVWSASPDEYIEPVWTGMTEDKTYYIINKKSEE